jgi:hypothetical protein
VKLVKKASRIEIYLNKYSKSVIETNCFSQKKSLKMTTEDPHTLEALESWVSLCDLDTVKANDLNQWHLDKKLNTLHVDDQELSLHHLSTSSRALSRLFHFL